eukprot:CAMPEP_0119062690 /NCGR_PEP_ID=MMETSP1178-20130426/6221_1 /TAXON_ID=33656 /ORGANISM="unid sp, Strain CCMP2000" /LENGTH=37 /DNA_ID= /DNA_START= /DNA_END= /DNA_ORIENTATION=
MWFSVSGFGLILRGPRHLTAAIEHASGARFDSHQQAL